MPGKKRKADSSSSMWGSSQSPSGSRRSNNKQSSSSSSRRGGGAGAQGSGAYPYINEASASKLFEEICDEDDPHVAGMEGEFVLKFYRCMHCRMSLLCCWSVSLIIIIIYSMHALYVLPNKFYIQGSANYANNSTLTPSKMSVFSSSYTNSALTKSPLKYPRRNGWRGVISCSWIALTSLLAFCLPWIRGLWSVRSLRIFTR